MSFRVVVTRTASRQFQNIFPKQLPQPVSSSSSGHWLKTRDPHKRAGQGRCGGSPRVPRGPCGRRRLHTRSCILCAVPEHVRVAGDLLRLARAKAGLTQDDLAFRAGVAQSLISAYENGRRQPTMPTLMRLLEASGFDLRMRLAPPDVQASAAEEWGSSRPLAERKRWKREQTAAAASRR